MLTHARGLQNSLIAGEFDKLGGIAALGRNLRGGNVGVGAYEEDQGVATKKALQGDWTSFQGWTDGGAYAAENVINVGADQWWGHPQGTMSEAKWYKFLKKQGGNAENAKWLGKNGIVLFVDADKVAGTVWPWRGGN